MRDGVGFASSCKRLAFLVSTPILVAPLTAACGNGDSPQSSMDIPTQDAGRGGSGQLDSSSAPSASSSGGSGASSGSPGSSSGSSGSTSGSSGSSSGAKGLDASVDSATSQADGAGPKAPDSSTSGSGTMPDGSGFPPPNGDAGDGGTATEGGGAADGGLPCSVQPVTPNATSQTHKVLCYLHAIYGKGILSSQEEDNNDNGMNTVFQATGKYPAIRAFDVNNSMAPTQCVAHWNAGGLCMFGYHMGINGGTFNTPTNINNVLASGTAENTSFRQDLDRIAQFVQPLQAAGGVAILRLFHEAGKGCNWFWWSMGSSAQWQQLFKYAFGYLTATKGLNNVLWIAPLCGSPDPAYNPGPQYIDFGGADTYVTAGDYEPLTSLFQQTEAAFPNMMVALHENGSIPDPVQLQATGTKWLFFNTWASPYFTAPNNTAAHLQAVYSNPYVITRDKLPSFGP